MNRNLIITLLLVVFISSFSTALANENNVGIQEATIFYFDDTKPFEDVVGPDHLLYELKIAFENIDERFTFDIEERLDKQISTLKLRIAETEVEIEKGDKENADLALGYYIIEIEDIEKTLVESDITANDLAYFNDLIHEQGSILQGLIQQQTFEDNNSRLLIALDKCQQLNEVIIHEIENTESDDDSGSSDDSGSNDNSGSGDDSDPSDNSGSGGAPGSGDSSGSGSTPSSGKDD